MKKQSYFIKKNYRLVCLFLLTAVGQSAFSQQDAEANVYLFKKNWTSAKEINEATYFMQLIHENDTTYACRYYYKFGGMLRQETFLDSMLTIPNGRFCWYDPNGILDSTGLVYRGRKTGAWKYYNDNVEPVLSMVYSNGHLVEKRDYLKNEYADATGNATNLSAKEKAEHDTFVADSLVKNVQFEKAVFGESDSGKQWKEYLKKNIAVPERFNSISTIGSCLVTVSFIINKEGKTDDIYLTRSCEWSADNEVFNAIRKSPQWAFSERGKNNIDNSLQETVSFHSHATMSKDSAQKYGVFIGFQVPAKFPGGAEAWQHFLAKNLNVGIPSNYNAPAGQYLVVISFLIQKDGSVAEVKAEKDPGYGTAQEAIRVFKKSPKWIPAIQNGKPVIYRQKQEMTFTVFQQ